MTVAKIWNGSSWITPGNFNRPRVWTGSTWDYANPYVYRVGNTAKTLTVGYQYNPGDKFVDPTEEYGYDPGVYGSISTTDMPYVWVPDTIITGIIWSTLPYGYGSILSLWTTSTTDQTPDGGWTSMTLNGTTFTRAAGGPAITYASPGFNYTRWIWAAPTNPFPAAGNTINVTWAN